MSTPIRGNRKQVIGMVIKDKMNKSCVVQVEDLTSHKLYKKVIRRKRSFMVHDEQNEASVDDKVSIMEIRPLSKLKHWRLVEILEKAHERKGGSEGKSDKS